MLQAQRSLHSCNILRPTKLSIAGSKPRVLRAGMRNLQHLPLSLLLLAAGAGCSEFATAEEEDGQADGPTTSAADLSDDKADSAGTIRVRAGQLTVWIQRDVTLVQENGELTATITGRTSRNLTGVLPFVPDDAFGTGEALSARTFSIKVRQGHELNTILSGMPLFVDLDVATGAHADYALRLDLRPQLGGFSGSNQLFVDRLGAPIFVGADKPDPLRYQFNLRTTNPPVAVVAAGAPDVYPSSNGTFADFSYADLAAIWQDDGAVAFTDASGATKAATLHVGLSGVALTTDDAYDVWPAPTCSLAVFNCMREVQGVELATCGTYRELNQCLGSDGCEFGSPALELTSLDLSFAWESALAMYGSDCARGGGNSWCDVQEVNTFTLPVCLTPTFANVVEAALDATNDPAMTIGPFASGDVRSRDNVLGASLFATSLPSGGPGLFTAFDQHFGGGVVHVWTFTDEIPCQNCHSYRTRTVLWWPAAARVVVVDATHGYDS